ncbi:MAG: GTPase HflX [Aquificaceae bacterium]|nr:GTPase HflX [Aquificaceae bacterium]MCX7989782.1 GTPase HflX [Aquificaceae bacterium]MDW8033282.1 GTPase HflX [Aquificaceae bacterium]MDW8295046.1 GTPase HflX [Aquificaceae bacterium]
MKSLLVSLLETGKQEERESLEELKELVRAVGGHCIGYITQKKSHPDPKYYVGAGKVEEIKQVVEGTDAEVVIFDAFLSPSQVSNLERSIGKKVMDRADLVLEIFSRRVRSKTAKLQVELAKLTYELPRLYGKGKELSRLGGGVGTRGPGEQEAEIRRRWIKKRIQQIKEELEDIKRQRREQRKRRESSGELRVVKVALVGYTNAGKSSLLKLLTGRDTLVADMPFATLDTTTSARFLFPDIKVLITDTVGFIRKLPPELIESFKATLEEVQEADLILHVIDLSDRNWLDKVKVVREILKDLSAEEKPVIYVFNKADRVVDKEEDIKYLTEPAFMESRSVVVSAVKGWGIGELLKAIKEKVDELQGAVQ